MNQEETESLPESIREWDEVTNSKDLNTFWDRMKNMRSKLGTGLYQPGEDAGDEAWGKFSSKAVDLSKGRLMPMPDSENAEQQKALHKSLGVPEDIGGYEFAEIEGSSINDSRKEFISKIALEANLSKKQLKILDSKYREEDLRMLSEHQHQADSEMKALGQEWGLSTDDRINSAKKVQKAFFPQLPEDLKLSAGEIRSFYSLYKQLDSKSSEFSQQEHQNQGGDSPDEAASKIAEIRSNPKHPYHSPSDPGHAAAKRKMRNLYLTKNNISS